MQRVLRIKDVLQKAVAAECRVQGTDQHCTCDTGCAIGGRCRCRACCTARLWLALPGTL